MDSAEKDRLRTTEIDCGHGVFSAFFTPDGKQVFSGGKDRMIRRWKSDDGREVGTAIHAGDVVYAAALSVDRKWLVCGLTSHPYAGVWSAETHAKVLDITDHTNQVLSVDISSDSTKFSTGGLDKCAFIWSITTGKRLVGPLQHDSSVVAVRFSPDSGRLATAAARKSIRIFNSDDGQQLLDITCSIERYISSPLAWSADGRQIFATSLPSNEAKCFDTSSGSLLNKWPLPPSGSSMNLSSIAASSNEKFIAVTRNTSMSFLEPSTSKQIGPVIDHASEVYSMMISPDCSYVVTGEKNGTVTVRSLRGILPDSYFTGDVSVSTLDLDKSPSVKSLGFVSVFPLMQINGETLESWTQGDLVQTEKVLTENILDSQDPFLHSQYLAQRSLVRSRLKEHDLAIDDAKKSVQVQWSTIGQIAITVARAANGDHDAAMRVFDLVFTNGSLPESNFVLLIKAIILFQCGRHNEAISRVEDLIDATMDDKTIYTTIRARMHIILTGISLKEGDHARAAEWLKHAEEPVVPQDSPKLVVISLIFGWNFGGLSIEVQQQLQQRIKMLEDLGDVSMQSENAEEAIACYSTALYLNPSNPARLLVKRSKTHATMMSWEAALKDADDAVEADPQNSWGYERKQSALHALERYEDAADTIKKMIALERHCGDAALCQVFEELMARSGETTVLGWTGESSSYNSCIPASLTFRPQTAQALPAIEDVEMDRRVSELRGSISQTEATLVHTQVMHLPLARFAHRKLYLPCISFPVRTLVEKQNGETGEGKCFNARVSGIGHVEFQTSDMVLLADTHKLVFVHPWIRDLRGPLDEDGWGSTSDSGDESESWSDSDSHSRAALTADAPFLYVGLVATTDDYTRALQFLVRLQQPFRALLLQRQSHGEYKRVATEHEIVLPGLKHSISSAKDIRVGVVEIA